MDDWTEIKVTLERRNLEAKLVKRHEWRISMSLLKRLVEDKTGYLWKQILEMERGLGEPEEKT